MKLIRQLWLLGVLVGLCTICGPALLSAQWWDLKETAGDRVAAATGDRLTITLDFRTRYESRQGVDFGRRPDQDGLLMRTRFGMSYKAADWVKLSGMMEDLRSPGFGAASSASTRGSADLLGRADHRRHNIGDPMSVHIALGLILISALRLLGLLRELDEWAQPGVRTR